MEKSKKTEKKKRGKLLKIIKVIFTAVAVVTLLFTTTISAFASAGISQNNEYIYAGNVDYTITVFTTDPQTITDTGIAIGVSPLFSNSMLNESYNSEGNLYVETSDDYYFIDYVVFNYEATNGFINAMPTNGEAWRCQYDYFCEFTQKYDLSYIQVEARDFYFHTYSDELSELFGDASEEIFAESVLFFMTNSMYTDGAYGTIYYAEAGKENNGTNRLIYEYTIDASETTFEYEDSTPYYFPVLPTDDTLGGLYTEPQLIYVEYLSVVIPVPSNPSVGYFNTGALYCNLYYNFRNDDIIEYELPISPIDPGIFADYTSWLGTAVGGFLDFQIVQGFTLGGIVMVLIAFMLCLWFLKVFAGG